MKIRQDKMRQQSVFVLLRFPEPSGTSLRVFFPHFEISSHRQHVSHGQRIVARDQDSKA